jgi:hypothetical protein
MDAIVGMRVRDSRGATGCVQAATPNSLRVKWTHESVLAPTFQDIPLASSNALRGLEVLTLVDGWKPLAEAVGKPEGAKRPKTLSEDIEGLVAEASALVEKKKGLPGNTPPPKKGKDLEKKAREKRSSAKTPEKKSGGGGHNPFKTKSKLGPGPRHGQNSQTNKWKCSCPTPYKCKCKAGNVRKTIRIKRAYKKDYNHEYKAWRKGRGRG